MHKRFPLNYSTQITRIIFCLCLLPSLMGCFGLPTAYAQFGNIHSTGSMVFAYRSPDARLSSDQDFLEFAGTAFESPTRGLPEIFQGSGAQPTTSVKPFSRLGIGAHVGLNGVGFDVASPISRSLNLRTGMDFFDYRDSFTDQGANVDVRLQLRSAHINVDWFPFKNWFRVSPLLVFANNNNVRASVIVPAGSAITLNGTDYISDPADPLRGNGSIDFSKVDPGLTVGVGNLVPRSRKHWTLPAELGFYYVGQPALKVSFTGSACNPSLPPSVGCQSVNQNQSFQASLSAFVARNNHNLSYAKFFPVFSLGVGYAF